MLSFDFAGIDPATIIRFTGSGIMSPPGSVATFIISHTTRDVHAFFPFYNLLIESLTMSIKRGALLAISA